MDYDKLKQELPGLAEKGLTYQEIADTLGVTKSWVHKWLGRMNIKSHYSLNNSQPNCRDCGVELDKENFKGNRCRKCAYEKHKGRRRYKRTEAINLLGDKCVDCGKTYPHAVYDFHHHSDDKEECVSTLIHQNKRLEVILNEASKCELLCSNCHRIRHFA